MKKPTSFLTLLFILNFSFLFAQVNRENTLDRYRLSLDNYTKSYPQEKVYLHFDKPYYAAGDSIWFKAYVLNAFSHLPANLSKVLYVELISPENTIDQRNILPIKDYGSEGDFALPDTLDDGIYRIRAYTHWMRNFDKAFFFEKTFKISKPSPSNVFSRENFQLRKERDHYVLKINLNLTDFQQKAITDKRFEFTIAGDSKRLMEGVGQTDAKGNVFIECLYPLSNKIKNNELKLSFDFEGDIQQKTIKLPIPNEYIDVQFFPEGGELLSEIQNSLAFKALNQFGKGVEVKINIYDQNENQVTGFKTQHKGMGRTFFTPKRGQTYFARVINENGVSMDYPLPVAKDEGFTINCNSVMKESEIQIYVFSNKEPFNNGKNYPIILVGQSRGRVHFYAKGEVSKNKKLLFKILKKDMPDGILQFTLFDEKDQPLAERLVFVSPSSKIKCDISLNKAFYTPREKVQLELKIRDTLGIAKQGNLSMSITDINRVDNSLMENNIYSYLLLSSELKGEIEEPAAYFQDNSFTTKQNLDLLMMTQGWRRFYWKKIIQNEIPEIIYPIERGLSVNGQVKGFLGKKVKEASVMMLLPNKSGSFYQARTDEQGYFSISGYETTDTTLAIIQALNKHDRKAFNLRIDEDKPAKIENLTPQENTFEDTYFDYLQNIRKQTLIDQAFNMDKNVIQLEVVEVNAKREDNPYTKNSTMRIHGDRADQVLEEKDVRNEIFPLNALRRVPGVQVFSGVSGRPGRVQIRGMSSINLSTQPLFLIDGTQVDIDAANSISAGDIESIEVLKGSSASIYGSRGGNGVIAIYTKRGENVADRSPGVLNFVLKGYSKAREFYSPNYDLMQKDGYARPDIRTTLYWNPNININENGETQVSFFTADEKTTYQVRVEGIGNTGEVIQGEYFIKVE